MYVLCMLGSHKMAQVASPPSPLGKHVTRGGFSTGGLFLFDSEFSSAATNIRWCLMFLLECLLVRGFCFNATEVII